MDDLGRCRPSHINITFPPPRGVLHVCRTLGAKEECDGIYVSRKVTSQANSLLSPAISQWRGYLFWQGYLWHWFAKGWKRKLRHLVWARKCNVREKSFDTRSILNNLISMEIERRVRFSMGKFLRKNEQINLTFFPMKSEGHSTHQFEETG